MSLLQERHTIPVYKLHQHWQTARLAEKGFLAELQPNKHAAFYKELLVQNQKLREFLELPPPVLLILQMSFGRQETTDVQAKSKSTRKRH